jgi:HD-like signal output (HDOD) protein
MDDTSSDNVDDNVTAANESTDETRRQKTMKLRGKIDRIDDLPSLPVAVEKVNQVMHQQGSDAEDVGEALKAEPSLVAKVLKMVNSAYFGLRRRITSISEAVVYLGFETVRNLVINASVMRLGSSGSLKRFEPFDFNWSGFWKKSVATGIATETVAREIRVPGHEAAMPAGTLHMLGILVLRSKLPQKFIKILKLSNETDMNYFDAEIEILGTRSTEVGRWLSEGWNLPDDTLIGLANWQDPMSVPEEKQLIPLIVHTGERLARARGVGWNPMKNVELSKAIISELDISPSQFEDILNTYRRDLKDAKLFLELCEEMN